MMKYSIKSNIALLLTIFVICGATSQANAAILSKTLQRPSNELGLVGWWTMDGKDMLQNVRDRSGQGNTASLYGQTATTTVPGKLGQALSLDGVDDYVATVGSIDLTGTSVVSVSLWAKSSFVFANDVEMISFTNGSGAAFAVEMPADASAIKLVLGSNNNFSDSDCSIFTPPSANAWHHYVFIFDTSGDGTIGGDGRMFVDGLEQTLFDFCGGGDVSGNFGTNKFTIGNLFYQASNFDIQHFQGIEDDVRLYNRALSAPEVTRLYHLGATSHVATSMVGNSQLSTGLLTWWTFDGKDMLVKVGDASGLGNVGRIVGQISTTTAPGPIGQAISLDGVNDYVESPEPIFLSSTNIVTFSFWAWINSFQKSGFQTLLYHPRNGNPGDYDMLIEIDNDTNGDCTGGPPRFVVAMHNSAGGGNTTGCYVPPSTNVWHHYSLTFDKSTNPDTVILYIDGILQTASETSSSDNVDNFSDTPLFLGSYNNGTASSQFTEGKIDDFRIYTRTFSISEVVRLYQMGQPARVAKSLVGTDGSAGGGLASGLVGWWTFDGKNMLTNVADTSGQADHGNLVGQISTTTVPGKLGQALSFDGVDDLVSLGASFNGVQSVAFWIKLATSTTQNILDLNGTQKVTLSSGTLSADNFTSPTIYVDGVVSSTVSDFGWHHVVITTGTGINASAFDIGRANGSVLGGTLDDVRTYSRQLSGAEITRLYQISR